MGVAASQGARPAAAPSTSIADATDRATKSAAATREHVETLEKKATHLERLAMQCGQAALARKVAGDMPGTLAELRRKVAYEKEVAKLRSMAEMAETHAAALEGAALDAQHIEAMRAGAAALAEARAAGVSVEAAAALQDDVADALAEAEAMAEMLGGAGGALASTDGLSDADLLSELEGLQQEQQQGEGAAGGQRAAPPSAAPTASAAAAAAAAAAAEDAALLAELAELEGGGAELEFPSVPLHLPAPPPSAAAEAAAR